MIRHLAIIMDGNGRWAKARGLPRLAGHQQGAEAVKTIATAALARGIQYLTLYAFSSENWSRPQDEVSDLMNLMRRYLHDEASKLKEKGIALRVMGDTSRFPEDIQALLAKATDTQPAVGKLVVTFALSYSGREELCRAFTRLLQAGTPIGLPLTPATLAAYLDYPDTPDPDLIIRTSGEQRLSNFMLWQAAYSELYFTPKHWPEFGEDDLDTALADFATRERRYGAKVS